MKQLTVLISICALLYPVQASNILVLSPLASKSHLNVFRTLAYGLVSRGHTVTHVAPFAPSRVPAGYKPVIVENASRTMEETGNKMWMQQGSSKKIFSLLMEVKDSALIACKETYSSKNFQDLTQQKFDLILGKFKPTYIICFQSDCIHILYQSKGCEYLIILLTITSRHCYWYWFLIQKSPW
jgi:hypothetical protein